jgi:hypothetical protein
MERPLMGSQPIYLRQMRVPQRTLSLQERISSTTMFGVAICVLAVDVRFSGKQSEGGRDGVRSP